VGVIERGVEVDVAVETAYNQWTQFEEFPQFMEGLERVEQIDDTHLHWVAKIAGVRREWDAEITEQIPNDRIAWRSMGGTGHSGVVTFHHLAPGRSKVMLQMEFDPEGLAEQIGDKLGFVEQRIEGDLKRFKEFVSSRGVETGAWRGKVERKSG
jgi:uncharacterized membrane protein